MANETKIKLNHPENAHIGQRYTIDQKDDEISLKELILKVKGWWAYLWSKWLTILIVGIIETE